MFRRQEDGGEIEKDFLIRQVKKLVQAIKAILKLVDEARVDQAESDLHSAAQDALRVDPRRLAGLDPASCRLILRSASRMRMYAVVLRAEAALCKLRGDVEGSASRIQRATRIDSLSEQFGPPDREEVLEMESIKTALAGLNSAPKI